MKTTLKESDFTVKDIMELDKQLESVSTLDTFVESGKKKSFEDICKHIMNEAFGIGWLYNEIYVAYYKYFVLPCKMVLPSMTKGYVWLADK